METKIMKFIVFACLIAGSPITYAQNAALEESVSGCSFWSKDPKCWENQDHTKPARPARCQHEISCEVIKSVHQESSGQYYCKDSDGHKFSCNKLVEEFGPNLEGVSVKITTRYVDGCHILGGCGGRACVAGFGVASLDPFCQ